MVKFPGARGGRGYFVASSPEEFNKKIDAMKARGWLETILKEASEQSHRIDIPQIEKVMSLKELANVESELKLICSLSDNNRPLEEYLLKDLSDILFVIGPEGGFSQKEEEYLLNNNFLPTTLGKRVLRVETAAIYVSSIINYVYKG